MTRIALDGAGARGALDALADHVTPTASLGAQLDHSASAAHPAVVSGLAVFAEAWGGMYEELAGLMTATVTAGRDGVIALEDLDYLLRLAAS